MKRKIFMADDCRFICALVADHLAGLGYEVEVAESGTELLSKLVGQDPAAVIVDLSMVDGDGQMVLRELKRPESLFHDVPVIVLSDMEAMKDRVTRQQAAAFVPKSADALDELARVLRREIIMREIFCCAS